MLSRNEVAVGAFFPPGPGGTESVRTESMYARGIPVAERDGLSNCFLRFLPCNRSSIKCLAAMHFTLQVYKGG